MRILFVARHDSGDNDDEGALAHALRGLGHDVTCVHERRRHRSRADGEVMRAAGSFDLCLFLKWPDVGEIAEVAGRVPCAYWHFDLIDGRYDDTLADRSESRIAWCRAVNRHVRVGFHTDGDWVRNESARGATNLRWLAQGADARFAGPGAPGANGPDILFAGMVNHGRRRAAHVRHLQERWGDRFVVLGDGGPRWRLHGRRLADYLASAKVVVAPDGPVTGRYWSNRVYLTLGFGAFLLHPHSEGLADHYDPVAELQTYAGWDHCDELIGHYLERPESRVMMARRGHEATLARHTYTHRAAELVRAVTEVL